MPKDLQFAAHTLQAGSGLAGAEGLDRGTLRGQASRWPLCTQVLWAPPGLTDIGRTGWSLLVGAILPRETPMQQGEQVPWSSPPAFCLSATVFLAVHTTPRGACFI